MNDYAPVRRTLRAMLQPAIPELTIVDVTTTQEADALALTERPDLVILSDHVADLKAATPEESADGRTRVRGAEAYVRKVFYVVAVRALVRRLLGLKSLEEE